LARTDCRPIARRSALYAYCGRRRHVWCPLTRRNVYFVTCGNYPSLVVEFLCEVCRRSSVVVWLSVSAVVLEEGDLLCSSAKETSFCVPFPRFRKTPNQT